jgi:hypothetical protein
MSEATKNLLILKNPALSNALGKFADDLVENEQISTNLSYDPVGTVAQYFGAKGVNGDVLSKGNRLVLGLLTNDGFRDWAAEYNSSIDLSDEAVAALDRGRVVTDVSTAMLKYADPELVSGLLELGQSNIKSDCSGYFAPGTGPDDTPDDFPIGIDPTIAEVVAVHETVLVVAAVAVLVVVVTQIDVTPRIADDYLTKSSGTEAVQVLTNAGQRVIAAAKLVRERGDG